MTPIKIERDGIVATIDVSIRTIYTVNVNDQSIESTNVDEAVTIAKNLIDNAKRTNEENPALG